MRFLRYVLLTFNWVVIALAEMIVLMAGLIAPGHDKARLIPLALAVIILPVIGYGVHLFMNWLLSPKSTDEASSQ